MWFVTNEKNPTWDFELEADILWSLDLCNSDYLFAFRIPTDRGDGCFDEAYNGEWLDQNQFY